MGEICRVLLIEDNPGDADLMRIVLDEAAASGAITLSFEVHWANCLAEGLARLDGDAADIVLLDLLLPDSRGLDTFERVHQRASFVPIIVLSGMSDTQLAMQAVRSGAQDYLVKGQMDWNLLARTIYYAIERKRIEMDLRWESAVNAAMVELSQSLISPVSIGQISDMVLERAQQLTGSRFGFVGYMDPQTGYLVSDTLSRGVWSACRVSDKSTVFNKFSGLWGWALKNCQSVLTNCPQDDSRSSGVPEGHVPIERFLAAPAMLGDELVGLVALANPPRDYTDRDLKLAQRFASLFALAVQRERAQESLLREQAAQVRAQAAEAARLELEREVIERQRAEQEAQRNYQTQTVLNKLLSISMQNIPLQAQLEQIFKQIISVPWLAFQSRGGIFLVEDDTSTLALRVAEQFDPRLEVICARVPFGYCLCGRAAQSQTTQFSSQINERHEMVYNGMEPHGHYCVPIVSNDTVLGVIALYLRDGHSYDAREQAFLEAVANVLAGIIQRRRAQEQLADQQVAMQSVYELVITGRGSLVERCDQLVMQLSQVLQVSHATVEKLSGGWIDIISMVADGQVSHGGRMSLAGSPCEQVFQQKNICYYHQPLHDLFPQDEFFIQTPLFTYLGVPLLDSRENVIGVLHVMDRRVRQFSEHQVHLLEILARHMAHEIERERIEAQLLQAQKMEVIGQFAGGIAHDFGNLLTIIRGNVDMALLDLEPGQDLYQKLDEVRQAAELAAVLTRQLLTISRRRPVEKRWVNLGQVVQDMGGMLQRLIGKHIALDLNIAPCLWPVEADVGQLEQVLMNITVNARDAMPNGGHLFIHVQNVVVEPTERRNSHSRPGRFVCLVMQDTGIGMDEQTQNRLFEPFFTTKGAGKGTGLGLVTVLGIVQNHQGWIDVQSKPGQGTTFEVYLPARPAVGQGIEINLTC